MSDRQAIDNLPLDAPSHRNRLAGEYVDAHVVPRFSGKAREDRRHLGSQILAWLMISCGLLFFGAGGGLGARSILADVPQWWNLSLGMALFGQGLLVFGLVMLLARLWESSRIANQRLGQAIAQLSEIQRTADKIAGRQQTTPSAFYAHLAASQRPEIVAANLQGQLEQLATYRRVA